MSEGPVNPYAMAMNPVFPSEATPSVETLIVDVIRKGEFWLPAEIFFDKPAIQMHSFLCRALVGTEVVVCIIEVPANAISALVDQDMRVTFKDVEFQGDSPSRVILFSADSVSFK
jgi:hypothetical protein